MVHCTQQLLAVQLMWCSVSPVCWCSFDCACACVCVCVEFNVSCVFVFFAVVVLQPMEVYVDDETKLTLHGLQQYYVKLQDREKNRKLFDLLDALEFNQV